MSNLGKILPRKCATVAFFKGIIAYFKKSHRFLGWPKYDPL